jgi:DNA modification methylase
MLALPEDVRQSIGSRYALLNTDNFAFLPDGSIDFVLTDPPFNIARPSNFHTWKHNTIHNYQLDGDKGWDTFTPEAFRKVLEVWSRDFFRVLRKGGSFAIFCADAYISHLIDALEAAGLQPKRTITWRKPNAVPVNRASLPMSACEYIVWGVKPKAKWTFNADIPLTNEVSHTADSAEITSFIVADKVANVVSKAVKEAVAKVALNPSFSSEDVVTAAEAAMKGATAHALGRVENLFTADDFRACIPNYIENASATGKSRIHPTEKPVAVLRYLMAVFSNPGDLILDPFAGSGSTGEAAHKLGRRAILVERDSEYFEKAASRLSALDVDQDEAEMPGKRRAKVTPADKISQLSLLNSGSKSAK